MNHVKELSIPRTPVASTRAPAAIGPYNQAILVGDTLYCSGQIGIDPKTGSLDSTTLEAETERVLDNLGAVLREAGMSFRHVVRCTVYMTDMNDYGQINEIYGRYFDETAPAREAVQVAGLPRGARVEISCIAVR